MNVKLVQCWFPRPDRQRNRKPLTAEQKYEIRVQATDVKPSEVVVITGNQDALGNWQPEASPVMDDSQFPVWTIEIDASKLNGTVEYKFCTVDSGTGKLVQWEEGENRILPAIPDGEPTAVIESAPVMRIEPLFPRVAGTVIPVFSLRTETSFGIGDFGDLIQCIDWLQLTSQRILQLLPVNDTTQTHTWTDSYPYNAISVFALHPLYLNLVKLGRLKNAARQSFYNKKQKELNALPQLDYEQTDRYKWQFFREIFIQDGKETLNTVEYKTFYKNNRQWLDRYAKFSSERDGNETELYLYLQFHLHQQLSEAVRYAHSKGIALKGDIPIGVNRYGTDIKNNPHLFNRRFQTGAPPDNFSDIGQNWGFPTFNWEAIEKQDFRWWQNRLRKMAEYFDACRIDHILGFFRIWEIPKQYKPGLFGHFHPAIPYSVDEIRGTGFPFDPKQHAMLRKTDTAGEFLFVPDHRQKQFYHPAINAQRSTIYRQLDDRSKDIFNRICDEYFYHRNTELWKETGLNRLQALVKSTGMLPCGEDLGMIPSCVPSIMNALNILSLEIERMPKQYGHQFTDLNQLPRLSVCTTSTHDMDTLRLWWKENREHTQQYYNNVLNREGRAPEECPPEICEQIIARHLNANSMLAILPLEDWLSIDPDIRRADATEERINKPDNPHHYWRYRMHPTFRDMIKSGKLNNKIRKLVVDAGRHIP
jgi:4-alpha-glucanotransferase